MTDQLSRFREQKQVILDIYGRLVHEDLLRNIVFPNRTGTSTLADRLAELEDRRAKFAAENFRVAIVGRVNVGKSTLMNALLVGKNLLSMAGVPMTATITHIEHAESETLRVTFYSKEEWQELNQKYSLEPGRLADWASLLDEAETAGGSAEQVIRSPALIHEHGSVDEIGAYTAVPREGGKFSPFVSSILVTAQLRWGQGIDWVDTPGTADPNIVRAQMTQHWIRRADAVVYLTDANQAGPSASDVEFLADYVAHVPASRRLIVINKVDSVKNQAEIVDQFERLRGLRTQNPAVDFMVASQGPVLVSAEAGLEFLKFTAGGEFSQRKRERYLRDGLWGWAECGMGALEQELARVLTQSKGDELLRGERAYFKSIAAAARREWRTELAGVDEAIAAASFGDDVLERELKAARVASAKLQIEMTQLKDKLDELSSGFQPGGHERDLITRRFREWGRRAYESLEVVDKPRLWRAQVTLRFGNIFRDEHGGLIREILKRLDDVAANVEHSIRTVEAELLEASDLAVGHRNVSLDRNQIRDNVAATGQKLMDTLLSEFKPTTINWFWDALYFNQQKQLVVELNDRLLQTLGSGLDAPLKQMHHALNQSVLQAFKQVEESLKERIRARVSMLEGQLDIAMGERATQVEALRARRIDAVAQLEELEAISDTWQRLWST
jgi:hypothetical protein